MSGSWQGLESQVEEGYSKGEDLDEKWGVRSWDEGCGARMWMREVGLGFRTRKMGREFG